MANNDSQAPASYAQRVYTGEAAPLMGRSAAPSMTSHSDPYGQAAGGTGSIQNAAGRTPTTARLARSLRGSHASSTDHGGPLDLSVVPHIIHASRLGPKDAELSPGELMSDADEQTHRIETSQDGSAVHHRANPDGSVTSTPLGAYDKNLAKAAMNAPWYNAGSSAPDFFAEG